MSEFIINSDQLERLIEGIEHKTDREINRVVCNGKELQSIVRCRDCKHFTPKGTHKFENGKVNADYCKYVRGWMLQITPDGFCAWAKRKEVDNGK